MADPKQSYPDNVPGEFFVDRTCIDCGTCYELTPAVFAAAADHSRVHAQPRDAGATLAAEMALVACPTGSIGTRSKHDLGAAVRAFPMPVDGPVHFCGFTSKDSFGAWSWLVTRPGGNVLVDSPRAVPALLDRIAEMGGVRFLVITHGDDLADHALIASRFGCERVMHASDVEGFGVTGIERVVQGEEDVLLAPDLRIIPTPGHTAGSIALLHDRWLFSGDHLWGSERGYPAASRTFCWSSWEQQVASVVKLRRYRFSMILPGHGPIHRARDADAMQADLERTIAALPR